MKIAVIGGGAIGALVAASLHKTGKDVVLVAREDQVAVINEKGLAIHGLGKGEIVKIKAVPHLNHSCNLGIFATKTQDLESAYAENHEYLEESFILTTQNGVQADNILSSHFEREKMLSSIVMFGATYVKPGEITYNFPGDWIIGRPYMTVDAKTFEIVEELDSAIKMVVSENIMGMKWLKLFVNFNNCIPALIGKSMQETFADMDLCKLSVKLLQEGMDIVKQANIELVSLPDFPVERIYGLINMPLDQAAGIIHKTLTTLSDEPLYGSILQSIMRRKTSEIDFINGEVVQMAKQMRQEAPLNETILDMVHEVERSGKFFNIKQVKEAFKLSEISSQS